MLSCASFVDRLYDEDCRSALEGRSPVPADVTAHLAECAACAVEWQDAGEDVMVLRSAQRQMAPASLQQRLRVRMAAESLAARDTFDWTQGLVWAAVGASLTLWGVRQVPQLPMGFSPLLLTLLAASFAFAANAVRQTVADALR